MLYPPGLGLGRWPPSPCDCDGGCLDRCPIPDFRLEEGDARLLELELLLDGAFELRPCINRAILRCWSRLYSFLPPDCEADVDPAVPEDAEADTRCTRGLNLWS